MALRVTDGGVETEGCSAPARVGGNRTESQGSGGTAAASRQGALRGCKWAFVFAGRFDNLSRRRNMMQGTSRATRPSPDPVSLFDLKTNATQVSEDAILIHLLPGSEHKIVV
jgi:hypothetical protein